MRLGFTFSEQQASYLDISYQTTYERLMELSLTVVRVAAYWNHVEPRRGEFDFSTLDWLVDNTPPNTQLVLTLGMKAPRWPEYYIPTWLRQANNMPDRARGSRRRGAAAGVVGVCAGGRREVPWVAWNRVLAGGERALRPGPALAPWTIGQDVLEDEIALGAKAAISSPACGGHGFCANQSCPSAAGSGRRYWPARSNPHGTGGYRWAGFDPATGATIVGREVFVRWPAFIWQHQVRSIQRMLAAAGQENLDDRSTGRAMAGDACRIPRPACRRFREVEFAVSEIRASGFQSALLWGAEYWYMRMQRFDDERWWLTAQQLIM